MKTIIDAAPGYLKAATIAIDKLGFRVGALPTLIIRAGKYTGRSKGKDIYEEMPKVVLTAVKDAGLETRAPFAGKTAQKIADAFRYLTGRLYKDRKISARFSIHDCRHVFAVREYKKDRDIYRLKKLLGHASIQVTENYLRGLRLL